MRLTSLHLDCVRGWELYRLPPVSQATSQGLALAEYLICGSLLLGVRHSGWYFCLWVSVRAVCTSFLEESRYFIQSQQSRIAQVQYPKISSKFLERTNAPIGVPPTRLFSDLEWQLFSCVQLLWLRLSPCGALGALGYVASFVCRAAASATMSNIVFDHFSLL